MNTYEHFIGKKIINVLRLDIEEDYELNFLWALFLQLDHNSGLLIGNDFDHEMTTIHHMTLDNIREEFETENFQPCLNELKATDKLNNLIGQAMQSFKIGQFKTDKFVSDAFIVKPGQYAGVIFQVSNLKVTIFKNGASHQLLFNSEVEFPDPNDWTLT